MHSFCDLLLFVLFKGPSGLEMKQDKKQSQEDSEEVVYLMDSGKMGVWRKAVGSVVTKERTFKTRNGSKSQG